VQMVQEGDGLEERVALRWRGQGEDAERWWAVGCLSIVGGGTRAHRLPKRHRCLLATGYEVVVEDDFEMLSALYAVSDARRLEDGLRAQADIGAHVLWLLRAGVRVPGRAHAPHSAQGHSDCFAGFLACQPALPGTGLRIAPLTLRRLGPVFVASLFRYVLGLLSLLLASALHLASTASLVLPNPASVSPLVVFLPPAVSASPLPTSALPQYGRALLQPLALSGVCSPLLLLADADVHSQSLVLSSSSLSPLDWAREVPQL